MNATTLRNVGIVLLLALVVFALPGGGTAAGMIGAFIQVAFGVGIWLFLMRMYREYRVTVFSLGDTHRGILYASLAALLFLGAAASRWFDSSPLTLLWFIVIGAAI